MIQININKDVNKIQININKDVNRIIENEFY